MTENTKQVIYGLKIHKQISNTQASQDKEPRIGLELH